MLRLFTDHKCFGMFGQQSPLNWTQAQAQCRSLGTRYDLASVQNDQEQGGHNLYHTNLLGVFRTRT